jgi:SPP1 family predicted phage head-tail adaptor
MARHSAFGLNHTLTVQYNASDGTTSEDWQTLGTVKADKAGLKGKLFYEAAALQAESDAMFGVHFTPVSVKIKPGMHIIDNGDDVHPYEVKGDPIDPDDRREWLEIHARRIEQGGD